jgi:general secretion pathway protein K
MFIAYVVSGVLLLSALAISFLTTTSTSYRLARNALNAAQSDAVAEAAIVRAVLGLLDSRPERRWRVDGTAQEFRFGGVKMRVAIQDELGRIDLNHADRSMIAGLLQSAGLGVDAAGALADKILDWRSAGPGKSLHGAKEPEYRAAGLSYGPRGGPFQSVDELKLVLGMTPGLYARIEPALTVYSGRQFIDPQFAPAVAIAALPGQSSDAAAAIVAARASQGNRAGTTAPGISLWGRAFGVRLEVERPGGVLTREIAVRLADRAAQPYWLLSWRSK